MRALTSTFGLFIALFALSAGAFSGDAAHPAESVLILADSPIGGAAAETCGSVYTFAMGSTNLVTFQSPPSGTVIAYKVTASSIAFGTSEIIVKNALTNKAYEETATWTAGIASMRAKEAFDVTRGGTWSLAFDSDPLVIAALGNVSVQVCWT